MNPAFSVILLTTLIGVGQGLFMAMVGFEQHWIGAQTVMDHGFYIRMDFICLGFLICGLGASFFHLGHPERAWRAVAMWRTSWLSREVIVLPLTMVCIALHALTHMLAPEASGLMGLVGLVCCLALYFVTAMNYICLKFLQEWASPLTFFNFTLLGLASGFTLANALCVGMGTPMDHLYSRWAIVLTVLAAISRSLSLYRNASLRPRSTLQTAIGIKNPSIRQISQGFMGSSFNTREFFHAKNRLFVQSVKWGFILLTFILPCLFLTLDLDPTQASSPGWAWGSFIIQYVGLIGERWFFFAQARHPQNLYYQSTA
jgi:DMSO reductase anchor subunit